MMYTFDIQLYNQPSNYVKGTSQYFTIYNDAYLGSFFGPNTIQTMYKVNGYHYKYTCFMPRTNVR